MPNVIDIPKGVYKEVVDRIKQQSMVGDVVGLINSIFSPNVDLLISLDLGIPFDQRADHTAKIGLYRSDYSVGKSDSVFHLSQLIGSIFEDRVLHLSFRTREYLELEAGLESMDRTVEEVFKDFDSSVLRRDENPPLDTYKSLRKHLNDIVDIYEQKHVHANFGTEDKKAIEGFRKERKKFLQNRFVRNHIELMEFSNISDRMLELLENDSKKILEEKEGLCEKAQSGFQEFLAGLDNLEKNLGYRYDLTPQTKFLTKRRVIEYARAQDALLKKIEDLGLKPVFAIMPCTTYLRQTAAQMYFDRNGTLQIRQSVKLDPSAKPDQIPIETDSVTDGNVIYLSVTADVNKHIIEEEGELKRMRRTWPRISSVLRTLGEYVYQTYFMQQKPFILGLYSEKGEFEGPYRHVAGELRSKPGTFVQKILIYRQMLFDHGREIEARAKFGNLDPINYNEDTWRELVSYFIGIYALGQRGMFPVEPEKDQNPKSFYNTIYRALDGFLSA